MQINIESVDTIVFLESKIMILEYQYAEIIS